MHGLLVFFVVLAVAKQCLSTWADGAAYKPDPGPPGPWAPWWAKATRRQQFAMCVFLGFAMTVGIPLQYWAWFGGR